MVGREGCYVEGTGAYYGQLVGFTMPLLFVDGYVDPPGYRPSPRVAAYHRGCRRLEPARDVDLRRLHEFYGIVTSGLEFPALNDSDVGVRPHARNFFPYYLLAGSQEAKAAIRALAPKGPVQFYEFGMYLMPTLKDIRYASIWNNKEPVEFPLFSGVKSSFGLGVMRGAGRTDLYLSWDGQNSSHSQMEQLGIVFYAGTHEALLDFGYMGSWGRLRSLWLNRTIAHNTVTVDEDVQKTTQRGQLERWADFGNIRICQASDRKAFAGLKQYRRTVALVDKGDEPAYCLDLFEVDGGRTHDQSWLANGTLLRVAGVPLSPRKGTLLGEGTKYGDTRPVKDLYTGRYGNGYGFIHELEIGACAQEGWSGDWQIEDSSMKLRILAASTAQDTLIRGACPYERVRHKKDERDKKGHVVIVRRQAHGDATLSSLFATAIEPYREEFRIESANRLPSGRGIQTVLNSTPPRQDSLELGDDGAITFLSMRGDKLRELVLIGNDRWEAPGWNISVPEGSRRSGTIMEVNGKDLSLLVDAPLPHGTALAGHLIHVHRTGEKLEQFGIKKVKKELETSRVFVDSNTGGFANNIGLVDAIVDTRTFETGSYFRSNEWGVMKPGDYLLIGNESFRIEKVEYLGGKHRNRVRVTLDAEVFKNEDRLGNQFVVSALAPGDGWHVDFPVHVKRIPDGLYQVSCPVKVCVNAPAGIETRFVDK